jgi:GAF domain-containing protein
MNEETRDATLLESFAMLADNLVSGYDVVDVLQTLVERCQAVLDASEAGILLRDEHGDLDVVAVTAERVRLMELLQLDGDGGPCAECVRIGRPVLIPEIGDIDPRWSRFGDLASEAGILSVYCVPLRLRRQTIGSLNLFSEHEGMPPHLDQVAAQAMADVATISILQRREAHESEAVREQLQRALDSRVLIEQAKGVVSYTRRIPVDEAFQLIRVYARSNRERLDEVAGRIVRRELNL